MVSFRRLHSHLKLLSNNDLKGTRTECGFKRAFATLFGQDVETFTGTMFLNVDQLEKQIDKEEFQEIGSMAAFKYFLEYTQLEIREFRDTLIQHMESIKKSIDKRALHKREYDSRVNERQMQTTEEEVDTSKALDASLVNIESSRTESGKRDTSSRSGNDAHANDADIRPIYDEESMAKVLTTAEINILATGTIHTDKLNPIIKERKIFTSSTTKVDSEPQNGSNDDITNQYECKQTLDVSAGTLNIHACTSLNPTKEGLRELGIHDHSNELSSSKLVPKVVPPADKTATSRQELELLFHHHITMLRDSLNLPITGFHKDGIENAYPAEMQRYEHVGSRHKIARRKDDQRWKDKRFKDLGQKTMIKLKIIDHRA
ncbi:hypothetical protein Tco_1107328 [Tanacetum coccineum]